MVASKVCRTDGWLAWLMDGISVGPKAERRANAKVAMSAFQ